MVSTCPSNTTRLPRGSSLAVVDRLLDILGDRAKIPSLRGRENLHHGLNVVLRHHGAGRRTVDLGDAAQHRRRRRSGAGNRQRLQLAQRVNLVLRRLHHDRIGYAVVRIEEECRRDLRAAREIHHHAVGHVARGQTDVLRAGAVHVHIKGGTAGRLLDARIGDAGNERTRRSRLLAYLKFSTVLAPRT
jgi:hypothetical protein